MDGDLEDGLAWTMRVAGLPTPEREYGFHPTRRWRFDFAWPELLVAVEVEGKVWAQGRHTRGAGFIEDCVKYGSAAGLGWRIVRVTKDLIEDGRALGLIEAALAWAPQEEAA